MAAAVAVVVGQPDTFIRLPAAVAHWATGRFLGAVVVAVAVAEVLLLVVAMLPAAATPMAGGALLDGAVVVVVDAVVVAVAVPAAAIFFLMVTLPAPVTPLGKRGPLAVAVAVAGWLAVVVPLAEGCKGLALAFSPRPCMRHT